MKPTQREYDVDVFMVNWCLFCAKTSKCAKMPELQATGQCDGIEQGDHGLECEEFER